MERNEFTIKLFLDDDDCCSREYSTVVVSTPNNVSFDEVKKALRDGWFDVNDKLREYDTDFADSSPEMVLGYVCNKNNWGWHILKENKCWLWDFDNNCTIGE